MELTRCRRLSEPPASHGLSSLTGYLLSRALFLISSSSHPRLLASSPPRLLASSPPPRFGRYWFVAEPTDEKLEELKEELHKVKIKGDDASTGLTWPKENPKYVKGLQGFKPREKKLDLSNLSEASDKNSR